MRKFIIKLTKTEKKINHRYDFESPLNLDTARVNFEKVIHAMWFIRNVVKICTVWTFHFCIVVSYFQ